MALKGTVEERGLNIKALFERLHKEQLDRCLNPYLVQSGDGLLYPAPPRRLWGSLSGELMETTTFWDIS